VCQKSVAVDLEQPRLALTAGAAKGINRRPDLDIYETTLLKHMPPACARQATGNSVGPQVDVAESSCWNLLAVRDVGKLQTPTWPQHPHDLGKDLALVGAQIDDAIADHNVGPPIFDRQILDHALAKLDIAEAQRDRGGPRPLQHFLGHIDAGDMTLGPDLSGRDKAVETAAGPEIDDPLAGLECAHRERVADTGKSFNRAVWQSGNDRLVIAQSPSQRASGVEMVAAVRIDGDRAVFRFDLFAQRARING
jgi:hypothetical protein